MTPAIDLYLLACFNDWRSAGLDGLFAILTWFGSLWLLAPLALGALFWRGRAVALLPLALATASVTVWAGKLLVGRLRPMVYEAVIGRPDDASFPSGHAAQAMAFALALILLAPPGKRRWVAALSLPLCALVALSRLYLQVHWPSDVLAGLLLGALSTLAVRAVLPAQPSNWR